jgi:endonuclease YncB( thermonuclease family)
MKKFSIANIFKIRGTTKCDTIEEKTANIDTDSYKLFSWCNKTIIGKPCNVYDGDTLSICWFHDDNIVKYRCRCLGYDSPEMRPLKSIENRDEIKRLAVIAKERFIELLNQDQTITVDCKEFDKYGRVLVTIYNKTNGNKSLNQIMIDENHGYEYYGGTKR